MTSPSPQELLYEWPLHILRYETAVFLGLTTLEAMSATMAFLLCVALVPHKVLALIAGLLAAGLVLLLLKKQERLGERSLPVYLWQRWRARRTRPVVRLTQVMSVPHTPVYIEAQADASIVIVE